MAADWWLSVNSNLKLESRFAGPLDPGKEPTSGEPQSAALRLPRSTCYNILSPLCDGLSGTKRTQNEKGKYLSKDLKKKRPAGRSAQIGIMVWGNC